MNISKINAQTPVNLNKNQSQKPSFGAIMVRPTLVESELKLFGKNLECSFFCNLNIDLLKTKVFRFVHDEAKIINAAVIMGKDGKRNCYNIMTKDNSKEEIELIEKLKSFLKDIKPNFDVEARTTESAEISKQGFLNRSRELGLWVEE